MGLGLKRADLRANAQAKLADALILLKRGRFSNAYYLAGYAIEIGLKACIASQFVAEVIPDRAFVNSIYSHKFTDLIGLAGLRSQLQARENADVNFSANWALVAQWNENTRYESVDAITAQAFIAAIADQDSGVFPWIQTYW